jgi:hypothetical protein
MSTTTQTIGTVPNLLERAVSGLSAGAFMVTIFLNIATLTGACLRAPGDQSALAPWSTWR